MAGRERSGAVAARGDLFDGRAWVVVPNEKSSERAVVARPRGGGRPGATVSVMSPERPRRGGRRRLPRPAARGEPGRGRLREVPERAAALAGQGLRDVTRIAASDPQLWTQILAGNAPAVREVLGSLREELSEVLGALESLESGDGVGAREVLARVVSHGNLGHARIPGKHGAAPTAYSVVTALVPDEPGELARLLHDVGEAGINLEDLHLEHGLGQPFGLAEISVLPAVAEQLAEELQTRGWQLHG